jgi:FkbM family methyltransferase
VSGAKATEIIFSVFRTIVKRPLNLIGIDLIRYHPRYEMGPYAFVQSLEIRTVIDVGAHSGEFALMIRKVLPEAQILSFEPLKEEFRELQQRMRDVRNFKGFNFAVGDHNGSASIHRSEYSQSSSLLPMADLHKQAFPESASQTQETVEVKSLDDALRDYKLDREVLLKIDVQGYDDHVIAGGAATVAQCKAIIIEVSFRELYEGQPLFDRTYDLLKSKGFVYMGNLYQLLNPLDGSPLQADALFVRQ